MAELTDSMIRRAASVKLGGLMCDIVTMPEDFLLSVIAEGEEGIARSNREHGEADPESLMRASQQGKLRILLFANREMAKYQLDPSSEIEGARLMITRKLAKGMGAHNG